MMLISPWNSAAGQGSTGWEGREEGGEVEGGRGREWWDGMGEKGEGIGNGEH